MNDHGNILSISDDLDVPSDLWKLPELGIPNEFRYFGATDGTFRYRNTEYNIGTDTDTDGWYWMTFSVSLNFPRRQRIFIRYMSDSGIPHHTNNAWQVCFCRLEIARNYASLMLASCSPPLTSSRGCTNANGGTHSWQQTNTALFKRLNVSFHCNNSVYWLIWLFSKKSATEKNHNEIWSRYAKTL